MSHPLARWARSRPVTFSLVGASILGYLLIFFIRSEELYLALAFRTSSLASHPWTLFTYPFVAAEEPLFFALGLYWLWLVGSELERGIGSARTALIFFGSAAASALGMVAWTLLFKYTQAVLVGSYLATSGLTIVWCLFNPGRVVLFSFLIPIPGSILAIVTAVMVYLSYGRGYGPVGGLFALGGCLYGYLYVLAHQRARRFRPTPMMRARTDRLTLRERYRLWRARRRLRKVWDSKHPDDVVH